MASDECGLNANVDAEVVDEKQVAHFVDMVTTDVSIELERNYNARLLAKNLQAAEGMLQRKEIEAAAIEVVNELFLSCIGTTFAGGDGKSCPEKKMAAPRRGRKRKMIEEPSRLKLLK